MAASTVLTRALRRTLLDSRYQVPPTFLLPWTASFHLDSTAGATTTTSTFPPPPSHAQSGTISSTLTASTAHESTASATIRPIDLKPLELSQSVRDLLPLLRSQGQIYISAHIHGKSYLLTQGDSVRLPFLMPVVEPGDTIRLNRAQYLGSRDLTLKSGAARPKFQKPEINPAQQMAEITMREQSAPADEGSIAPHFIPHIAKGKHSYLDERLFVCRALVTGVESEPLRIKEKTKRRQRHVKHVKSKHRYTILKISELRVRSLEEIEKGDFD